MNRQANHIVVIGGGVIGAMTAWELSQAGCEVTIVEQDRFGAACSHGNCGYVSPSHVLPLAQPGAVKKTFKAMLKPNSPFAVKPRFSRDALNWMWKFSRACNTSDMMSAAAGIHQLLQSSKSLYQQLIADEGIDCEWQERGLLFVFEHAADFDAYASTEQLIRNEFGIGATRYATQSLIELEPALKPVVAGAWHYEGDCHLRPDKLLSALKAKLESRGVEILEHTLFKSFVSEYGEGIAAILEDGQSITADHFVVATGAWAPFFNSQLGCRIPIQPGKGYSITMPTKDSLPKIPMIFEDTHVAITPMESKYRVGSTMEFVGYDRSIHPKRLGLLRASAERYLHDPGCEPVEEKWFGWRPMTWDGKPIIDRSPAMRNVWICAGHSMLGLSLATGSGRLMKELILAEKPHIDPHHFSAGRFG